MQIVIPIVIILLVVMLIFTLRYFKRRESELKTKNDEIALRKLRLSRVITYAGYGFCILLLVIGNVLQSFNGSVGFLKNLAAAIIIGWMVLLVIYYAWAIYFYNVNLGWSDDKWDQYRSKKLDGTAGVQPDKNPHGEETLGLPPGTVRGTIALTLLVVAIALVVGSLNEDTFLKPNSVLATHFDFLKDAFLMMIAFYFGAKSLDILKSQSQSSDTNPPKDPIDKIAPKLDEEQQKKIEPNFVVPGAQD